MVVGYQRLAVAVKRGLADTLLLNLTRLTAMQETLINSKRECKPCGKAADLTKLFPPNQLIDGRPGTQYALYIANPEHKKYGTIKELLMCAGKSGFPQEKFRLHIYAAVNTHTAPQQDLLTDTVVVQPNSCGWGDWDLSYFNIDFPETGCFIGLEFNATKDPQQLWPDYDPYVKMLKPSARRSEQSIWSYSKAEGWQELPAEGNVSYVYNSMIKLFVDASRYSK